MSEMVKLTGLWINTDKNGNQYFAGSLSFARVSIFPNTYKKQPNEPDYFLYITEGKKRGQQGQGQGQNYQGQGQGQNYQGQGQGQNYQAPPQQPLQNHQPQGPVNYPQPPQMDEPLF